MNSAAEFAVNSLVVDEEEDEEKWRMQIGRDPPHPVSWPGLVVMELYDRYFRIRTTAALHARTLVQPEAD